MVEVQVMHFLQAEKDRKNSNAKAVVNLLEYSDLYIFINSVNVFKIK
jgi:hypothetical protein